MLLNELAVKRPAVHIGWLDANLGQHNLDLLAVLGGVVDGLHH